MPAMSTLRPPRTRWPPMGSDEEGWLRTNQLRTFFSKAATWPDDLREDLRGLLEKHVGKQSRAAFEDHLHALLAEEVADPWEIFERLRTWCVRNCPQKHASCAERERKTGKPKKVAKQLLDAYAVRRSISGDLRYVDIGAGTGTTALAVKNNLKLDCSQVRAFDVDLESCGLPDHEIQVEEYDGEKLPLDDESVDLGSCVQVLHHVEPGGKSLDVFFEEVWRVLKPNGRMLVKEHDSPSSLYDEYLEVMHSLKQLVFYCGQPQKMPMGSYRSLASWRRFFDAKGFNVATVNELNDPYRSVVIQIRKR